MCGHIRKLSSLVCLHNLGNKNYSKKTYSTGKIKTRRYCIYLVSLILDLRYFKSEQLLKKKSVS